MHYKCGMWSLHRTLKEFMYALPLQEMKWRLGCSQPEQWDLVLVFHFINLVLDSLHEKRITTLKSYPSTKRKIVISYNRIVKRIIYSEGDLVWKVNLPLGVEDHAFGKWSPKWEVRFQVQSAVGWLEWLHQRRGLRMCYIMQRDRLSSPRTQISFILCNRLKL